MRAPPPDASCVGETASGCRPENPNEYRARAHRGIGGIACPRRRGEIPRRRRDCSRSTARGAPQFCGVHYQKRRER